MTAPSHEPSTRIREAIAALERASLKKTPQRLAIVRAFAGDPTHPTAQQIFDRLRRTMPTMSFATVYNTLAALETAGACRTLRLGDNDSARFDPNVAPHDHAVCDRCRAVRDVTRRPAKAPASLELDVGSDDFEVRAVERVYRGLCAECRAKSAK